MAVRQGDWKLVSYTSKIDEGEFLRSDSREQTTLHRLYNLGMDIAETKDLASSEPDKVTELLSLWNAWNAWNAEMCWGQSDCRHPQSLCRASKTKANTPVLKPGASCRNTILPNST